MKRTHASPRTLKPSKMQGTVLVEGKEHNRAARRRQDRINKQDLRRLHIEAARAKRQEES